ncbi:MAG: VWA domain-containing protein [Actinobacteria bacterium]|nr:VWA domain-containing protein [Actinomycetota bacterium]
MHVVFVLDRSGSMSHLTDAVISGVDEFVSELRRDPGATRFSLTAFDTRVEHVHVAVPLADVLSLAETGYEPGGMTALYDAVAHTVFATDERLRASPALLI